MKHCRVQTVKLLDEERALLKALAGTRARTYSDVLRSGLYQLAASEGLHAQVRQALQARVDHLLDVEAIWQGLRVDDRGSVIEAAPRGGA